MENQTPDSVEPDWNCEKDGHEFECKGEYNPDTNSYPYLQCIYCGKEELWNEEDELDHDH